MRTARAASHGNVPSPRRRVARAGRLPVACAPAAALLLLGATAALAGAVRDAALVGMGGAVLGRTLRP